MIRVLQGHRHRSCTLIVVIITYNSVIKIIIALIDRPLKCNNDRIIILFIFVFITILMVDVFNVNLQSDEKSTDQHLCFCFRPVSDHYIL